MYLDTLTGNKLEVLLMQAKMECSKNLYLAGGTALALHLGHRLSRDLDWFGSKNIPEREIIEELQETKPTVVRKDGENTIRAYYSGNLETSFIGLKTLKPNYDVVIVRGQKINVARIEHIAAMKILAICNRGYKRDFIDVYAIVRSGLMTIAQIEQYSMKELALEQSQIRKALKYFRDADPQPMPPRSRYTWQEVKRYFESL